MAKTVEKNSKVEEMIRSLNNGAASRNIAIILVSSNDDENRIVDILVKIFCNGGNGVVLIGRSKACNVLHTVISKVGDVMHCEGGKILLGWVYASRIDTMDGVGAPGGCVAYGYRK